MTDADLIFDLEEPSSDGPIDVLSGSSLNTFLRCARQWEYAYVYRYKRPPKLRMVTGTAGHKGLEVHLLSKRETHEDGPLDVALDAYSDSFDLEVQEAEDASTAERGEWKDKGARSVKLWHKEVAPTIRPKLVEQPVSFRINGVPWTGTLDLSDENNVIIDHKFPNRTPTDGGSYLVNLVGYAIGFRELTGEIETQVRLDNIVQLKTPKIVKISSDGPVTDQAIAAFADTVESATRSIQAGIFPPNGLSGNACSWCGYTSICSAYKTSPMRLAEEERG
jgi:hypothetical protein